MEDKKLAAYYDDLTRRGGGAARFKQGLGFSSNASSINDDVPSRGSALPAASSFLSSFVKASSPSKTSECEKEAQLQSIQNKLSKKPKARSKSPNRDSVRRSRSPDRVRDRHLKRRSRSRSRSRDRIRDKDSKRWVSRSRSRDRHSRRRSRSRDRRSRRRSRSREYGTERRYRSRSRSREKNRQRSRRQASPEERRSDKGKKQVEARGGGGSGIDFAKLIEGYDSMAPAERVKAKMKLQLSQTAENDETIGKGSGWERFEFDKDAPLDDEEKIEAAEDDAVLVKNMGQSFRFSAVAARKEEEMKALHDEAIFGVSSNQPAAETDDEADGANPGKESVETALASSLLSNQVMTMNRGSWRDRASKR